jgi:acyl-CoA synthetase (AMP-forming)/AMP-acid ligase II
MNRQPRIRHEVHFGGRIVRCFADRPRSLHQLLADAVAHRPHGEALVCGTTRLTYTELDQLVARLATHLARLGLTRGDRIALALPNGIAFAALVFAAARIAAISVPLNPREGAAEFQHVLRDSGARILVHGPELSNRLPERSELGDLKHVLAFGSNEPDALAAFSEESPLNEVAPVREDDVAAVLYTSGTTGPAKGAMLTHLGIVHSSLHYVYEMDLGPDTRSVLAVPFSHITGFVAELTTIVRAGGTLIIMPAFKAESFLRLAASERMTHTILVPAMFNLCLLSPHWNRLDLSSWLVSGYGGALMPLPTLEAIGTRLPQLRLVNAYGATETTSPAVLLPRVPPGTRREWAGIPVPCDDVLVMDDEGAEAPCGVPGELWLAGPNVVPGYWNNPSATAREFVQGFWKSGDLGMRDDAGFIRVIDRIKDLVNRGGYKVPSAKVEATLLERNDIVEAAVIGRPCEVLGERVHAFVVGRDSNVDIAGALAWCAEQLADYEVPETITVLDTPLPRSANGKVLKRALRQLASPLNGAAGPAPN